MKKKLITLVLSALAAASLLALTACGDGNNASKMASNVSSFEETASAESTLSSESLGIYVQDTDNDGTPDKVVDKDGNDLSHLYTLKEDGIYEGETLILPMEHVQTYTTLEGEVNSEESTENTEQPTEQPAEQLVNTNVNTATNNTYTGGNNTTYTPPSNGGGNNGGNTNTGAATKPQQQQQTAAPAPQPQVHAPIYKQVWVVDQAAWSEERPVTEQKVISVCNNCGADVTGNAAAHGEEHALKGEHGGHHTEVIQVQTGTRTIFHEEVGHYENVLICGGCTGTH